MRNGNGGAVARLGVGEVGFARDESSRGWWGRLLSALERNRARSAARRELHRLDDRLLADIGLRRDQVNEFVDGMFRSEQPVAAQRPADEVPAGADESEGSGPVAAVTAPPLAEPPAEPDYDALGVSTGAALTPVVTRVGDRTRSEEAAEELAAVLLGVAEALRVDDVTRVTGVLGTGFRGTPWHGQAGRVTSELPFVERGYFPTLPQAVSAKPFVAALAEYRSAWGGVEDVRLKVKALWLHGGEKTLRARVKLKIQGLFEGQRRAEYQ